jgi:hypothetical protein
MSCFFTTKYTKYTKKNLSALGVLVVNAGLNFFRRSYGEDHHSGCGENRVTGQA